MPLIFGYLEWTKTTFSITNRFYIAFVITFRYSMDWNYCDFDMHSENDHAHPFCVIFNRNSYANQRRRRVDRIIGWINLEKERNSRSYSIWTIFYGSTNIFSNWEFSEQWRRGLPGIFLFRWFFPMLNPLILVDRTNWLHREFGILVSRPLKTSYFVEKMPRIKFWTNLHVLG